MGGALRRHLNTMPDEDPAELKQIIVRLEAEIQHLKKERKREERAHRKELAMKQAQWKKERKLLDEEITSLSTNVCEEKALVPVKGELGVEELREEWCRILAKQMKQQKQMEEAAEKWKTLYLTIKSELDQLIQATTLLSDPHHQGEERFCMEWMKEELKAKEETNKELRAKVSEMEKASAKREMEMDILRQSLRIMTTNLHKKQPIKANLSKSLNL